MATKQEGLHVLTVEELLQAAKNDLFKKELRARALTNIVKQAAKERADYMALPRDKRVNYAEFGRWNMGEAEIGQMRLELANVQRDIEVTKEYITILQEQNKK